MFHKVNVAPRIVSFFLAGSMILSLLGCGATAAKANTPKVPFTEASWDSTEEEIKALEGTEFTTASISSYGGDTCIFSKEYLGISGDVKYMFDDQGRLRSIAFFYLSTDQDAFQEAYTTVYNQAKADLGDASDDSLESDFYAGDQWELENGIAYLILAQQDDEIAFQYTYILNLPKEEAAK